MKCLLPFEKIKREILVKNDSETSDKFGKSPIKRTAEELLDYGIINLDKPDGPTSHQVSAYVKKILRLKKAGHSGTLDPKVTGVLPVALGKSTKIVQTLLKAGKEYVALMHLHKEIPEFDIYKALGEYSGKIKQLPPIKSSVKRRWRTREVYYTDVIDVIGKDVLFRIGCEAGTYIRKYIHDLGKRLDSGAHMAELRRTKVGPFREDTLFSLQDLADAFYYYKKEGNEKFIRKVIQPIENAVEHLPKIWVKDTTVDSICHGAPLGVPGISKLESGIEPDQLGAVMTLKGELICYGRAKMNSEQMIKKDSGIAFLTEKVIMDRGVYPKIVRK
ncbi:RNA-guided pseudouridylation complex pseudouridine synthase subunit Cbf5 [Candidatus Woesearchaeota archaeon]|nr:RNA-guided pseudouridylation complex pseudouridine synthase subunit Cbf5 [Candidatus Woesearchaeota archaeon]